MSPWELLEWASAVSISVALVVAAVFGTTIGVRFLIRLTNKD